MSQVICTVYTNALRQFGAVRLHVCSIYSKHQVKITLRHNIPHQCNVVWLHSCPSLFLAKCWEYTQAWMKLHHTVSSRPATVNNANNLRHMLRTCSCTVWPDSMVVSLSKCASLSSHSMTISISTQWPHAHTSAVMSSGSRTASHHTTPHWHGTVQCSFICA